MVAPGGLGDARAARLVADGARVLQLAEQAPFHQADDGVAVTSHMQFLDVDLENCLGQVFGLHRLEGRGNVAVNVEGSGDSVMAVAHGLNGAATLTAPALVPPASKLRVPAWACTVPVLVLVMAVVT